MLDNILVKQLDDRDCCEYIESFQHDLDVTNRRIAAIRKKQKADPDFRSYDKWADEVVGIDSRLEEQLAVRDEIESDLTILTLKLDSLTIKREHPHSKPLGPRTAQLSIFDVAGI